MWHYRFPEQDRALHDRRGDGGGVAGALVLRPANVGALWHLAGMQLAGEPLLNVSACMWA